MNRATAPDAVVSLDDGCLVVRFASAPDAIDGVVHVLVAIDRVADGVVMPVLWDVRSWASDRAATWIRLLSTVRQLFTAAALLHGSSCPRIDESFATRRSRVPFATFTSEPDAREFLRARTRPIPAGATSEPGSPGVVETAAAVIWLEDGVVFVKDKGVGGAVETVAESLAVIGELVGDRPLPLLWDAREWPGFAPEAWLALVSTIESLASSVAMVVSTERPVGPFPAVINRFIVPYRLFTDPDEALKYLRAQA